MKRGILLLLICSFGMAKSHGQVTYWTSLSEYIFSTSPYNGDNGSSILRFTALPNSEFQYNIDGGHFGGFFGFGVRNLGLIWEDSIKHKRRAQSFYIPAAIKIGNLDNDRYFTLGAEMDIFFHYKKKDWINGEKVKSRTWFSDEINMFNPSLALGWNYGIMYIRLKYQMLNFFNPNYSTMENGTRVFPYRDVDSRIIYLSIGFKQVLGQEGGFSELF